MHLQLIKKLLLRPYLTEQPYSYITSTLKFAAGTKVKHKLLGTSITWACCALLDA